MHRRFVNLVVDSIAGGNTIYNLHRVNVSGLFYRERARAAADSSEALLLPPPSMTFYPTGSESVGNVDFLPLSGSKDEDVVALGHDGHGLLYGAASGAVHILPGLRRYKGRISPISLTAGDSLYVIERQPFSSDRGCFEVLSHGIRPGGWSDDDFPHHGRGPGWYWRSLPPPPFAHVSFHHCHDTLGRAGAREYGVAACAVAGGGSQLWMTAANGGGTYSFDTVSGEWSKVGGWALPFQGRAEYVPEHKLWFGISPSGSGGWDRLLCICASSDLTGAVWMWSGLAPPSDQWYPTEESYLVPLGSGKFCVARFFVEDREIQSCVVFTGLEVIVGEDGGRPCDIRLLRHRSKSYTFLNNVFVRRRFGRVF